MPTSNGILAIFNDVAPGREDEFETWFQHEHLAERLAVPGFLIGRRYEALSGDRRFFNYYVTDAVDVLASPAYLARVNDPTPLTRRIMSAVFKNMIRTVCARSYVRGHMRGAAAVALRFDMAPDQAALRGAVDHLIADKAVVCGEIWTAADPAHLPQSAEERLRGGDRRIAACLLIETLRAEDAERIATELQAQFPQATVGTYRLLCELRA